MSGIRLNSISPGYFASEQTLAVPRDSPEQLAEWMAAHAGRVDGGAARARTARRLPAGRCVGVRRGPVVGQSIVIDGGCTAL